MPNPKDNTEIECRFLEIDKAALISKLHELGAKDLGETMLEQTIIYDKEAEWKKMGRFLRVRKVGEKTVLSYKEHNAHAVDGTFEIEFEVSDYKKAEQLLEKIGFHPFRHEQKLRHTFELDGATFDIDTWPRIPPYLEIEGSSEHMLQRAAEMLGYEWKDADFHNASWIVENRYNFPMRQMTWFTFDRFE